jgi:flavin reductase (DIM6/NTAB) family NADH-FMN oxidoreductase RutF
VVIDLAVDRDAFDALVAGANTAMVIVTASDGRARAGCLVGFHAQSSIEPARYAVWISKANRTYRVAERSTHLVIHFLDERNRPLAELFGSETGDEIDKFALADWEPGPDGVPKLADCVTRVVVRRVALVDHGGDHVCIESEPVEASTRPDYRPLRYAAVKELDPGHPVD